MVEGARLEIVYTATYRGFESLSLRHKSRPDWLSSISVITQTPRMRGFVFLALASGRVEPARKRYALRWGTDVSIHVTNLPACRRWLLSVDQINIEILAGSCPGIDASRLSRQQFSFWLKVLPFLGFAAGMLLSVGRNKPL